MDTEAVVLSRTQAFDVISNSSSTDTAFHKKDTGRHQVSSNLKKYTFVIAIQVDHQTDVLREEGCFVAHN
jgi:hypothetical protein